MNRARRSARRVPPWLLGLAVAAVALAVFRPALDLPLPYLDDLDQILQNPHVNQGLTLGGLRWAFSTLVLGHWNPLMFVSLMVDASLFGLRSDWLHFVNAAFHAATAGVLGAALLEATGEPWPSFAASLLFAVHPLRVESVAWISSRKDVLSLFFAACACAAYLRYGRRRSRRAFAAAHVLFVVSLLSKATTVSLPFVFLLFDYWPLGRWSREGARGLLKEKLGLLAIAAAFSAVAFVGKRAYFITPLERLPLAARLRHIPVSYVEYLGLTFWPSDMTPEHPFKDATGLLCSGALGLLALVTAAAWRARKKAPACLVGWLWFLGSFVPLIGVVQLEQVELANRYTYLPHVGLAIAVAWAGYAAVSSRASRFLVAGLAVFAAAACARATRAELAVWSDLERLCERSFAVNPRSYHLNSLMGILLARKGDLTGAERHLAYAVALKPSYPVGRANLGLVLAREGRLDPSLEQLRAAVRLAPESPQARLDLALILEQAKRWEEASLEYEHAIVLDDRRPEAYAGLANAEFRLGRPAEAVRLYGLALGLAPADADFHNNLGIVLAASGKKREAERQFIEALRLRPDFQAARRNLALAASPDASSPIGFAQSMELR